MLPKPPWNEQEDKLTRSLLLPLGEQSARTRLAEATSEGRMEGTQGLIFVAVGHNRVSGARMSILVSHQGTHSPSLCEHH